MPIKILSVEKEGSTPKTYTIRLEKNEREELKKLIKKCKALEKSVTSNIFDPSVSKALEFHVDIEEGGIYDILSIDPDNIGELEIPTFKEYFYIEEIKRKKSEKLSVTDSIIFDLYEYISNYSGSGDILRSGKNPISEEISRRIKEILSLSKEIQFFFTGVEERLVKFSKEHVGLTTAIYDSDICFEFEYLLDSLSKGHTVEIS